MKKLYEKLFEIQGLAVKKDADNPFFSCKYTKLEGLMEDLDPLIKKHGLLIIHNSNAEGITTKVIDKESLEEVSSLFPFNEYEEVTRKVDKEKHIEKTTTIKNDPQKIGSMITYGKRYNIGQLFNIITDEDDDGNKASQQVKDAKATFDGVPEQKANEAISEHGYCKKCNAKNVLNPNTGKIFCSDKCFLKK